MKKLLAVSLLSVALPLAAVAAPAATTSAPKEAAQIELQDGTKVQLNQNNEVFVIGKDGKLTPAPDGTHIAKDGEELKVKGGKLVN